MGKDADLKHLYCLKGANMGIFSVLLDLYENTRKTKTNVKNNKPEPRHYEFDGGLTGDRKKDKQICTPKVQSTKKETKIKSDGEER